MNEEENVEAQDLEDARMAVLEFTYQGEQGTVNGAVRFDLTDADLIDAAQEALRGGDVEGITQDETANLDGYKVDRFQATATLPNRVSLRPKTAFGDPQNSR